MFKILSHRWDSRQNPNSLTLDLEKDEALDHLAIRAPKIIHIFFSVFQAHTIFDLWQTTKRWNCDSYFLRFWSLWLSIMHWQKLMLKMIITKISRMRSVLRTGSMMIPNLSQLEEMERIALVFLDFLLLRPIKLSSSSGCSFRQVTHWVCDTNLYIQFPCEQSE